MIYLRDKPVTIVGVSSDFPAFYDPITVMGNEDQVYEDCMLAELRADSPEEIEIELNTAALDW